MPAPLITGAGAGLAWLGRVLLGGRFGRMLVTFGAFLLSGAWKMLVAVAGLVGAAYLFITSDLALRFFMGMGRWIVSFFVGMFDVGYEALGSDNIPSLPDSPHQEGVWTIQLFRLMDILRLWDIGLMGLVFFMVWCFIRLAYMFIPFLRR